MAESKLRTLSIDLVKALKNQHETIVSNQIGRAGTSIGANIHEAQYAHGKIVGTVWAATTFCQSQNPVEKNFRPRKSDQKTSAGSLLRSV